MGPRGEEEGSRSISVAQYFQEVRGMTLRSPHFNCVKVGPRQKPVFLPAELLTVYSPQKASLPFPSLPLLTRAQEGCLCRSRSSSKTPSWPRSTAPPPATPASASTSSFNLFKGLINDFNPLEDPFMRGFGITMDPNLLRLVGRVLPAPALCVGGNKRIVPGGRDPGVWPISPFVLPAKCDGFSLVSFLQPRDKLLLESFIVNLVTTCEVHQPPSLRFRGRRPGKR